MAPQLTTHNYVQQPYLCVDINTKAAERERISSIAFEVHQELYNTELEYRTVSEFRLIDLQTISLQVCCRNTDAWQLNIVDASPPTLPKLTISSGKFHLEQYKDFWKSFGVVNYFLFYVYCPILVFTAPGEHEVCFPHLPEVHSTVKVVLPWDDEPVIFTVGSAQPLTPEAVRECFISWIHRKRFVIKSEETEKTPKLELVKSSL